MEQLSKNNDKLEIVPCEIEYKKKSVEDILKEAQRINIEQVSKEVVGWLISNVENYIDNKVKTFKLDLVLDSSESMSETRKLQDLYRAIPDSTKEMEILEDEERPAREKTCTACRRELDKLTDKAHKFMLSDDERLQKLFKRLVYYYEMKGISNGKPLIKEMDGSVTVLKFEYEAFSVGVKILAPSKENEDRTKSMSKMNESEKTVIKQYTVEEGFTVWIELAFKSKDRPISLF